MALGMHSPSLIFYVLLAKHVWDIHFQILLQFFFVLCLILEHLSSKNVPTETLNISFECTPNKKGTV